MRRALLLVLLALPAGAQADGLPVGGIDVGPSGVVPPGSHLRYVTLNAGDQTVLAKVDVRSGRVVRHSVVHDSFTIPAVALDGSPGGLSADGRLLVLIRPRTRFPQAQTQFAAVDPLLWVPRRFTLRGDYSFDALSREGRFMYLIRYTSPRDPTRYEVRRFDLTNRRMDPDPVIDPQEKGEAMRGYPITRATSADGRFAYTLYDGGGGEPFLHALDTSAASAACIDLPQLEGRKDLMALRFRQGPGSGSLTVVSKQGPVLQIDPRTRAVTPPAPAPNERLAAHGSSDEGPPLWLLVPFVLTGALSLLLLRRRRPTRIPNSE